MKIGLVSDAHGNPAGLKSCLDHLRDHAEVDQIYFLGDAVGYFPAHNEVVDLLEAANATCLLGNHDAMLIGELPMDPDNEHVYRIQSNLPNFSPEHFELLASWPQQLEVTLNHRRLLFVHGSPWAPLTGYVYPDSDLDRFETPEFRLQQFDAVFMGHTHRPFIRSVTDARVVNPGSCGLPRDHGALASCAVYDASDHSTRILRIPMNVDELIDRFGGEVHASVCDCLQRVPESGFVGEVVDA